MATTLTIEAVDNTQKKWDDFITTLGVAEKKTGQLDEAAQKLADEMARAESETNAAERRIEELAVAIRKGSDEFGVMSKSVRATQEQLERIEKTTGFLKGGAVIEIFRAIGDGARKAGELISAMAEKGNVRFAELDKTISKTKSSFERMLDVASKTDFGGSTLDYANQQIGKINAGMEALPELWENLGTVVDQFFASAVSGWGEYGKQIQEAADYQAMLTKRIQDSRQASIESDEAAKQSAAGRKAASETEAALATQHRREAEQAAAAQIHNEAGLNNEIQKQLDLLNSGKVKQEEIKAVQEKIAILEQRRSGIRAEYQQYLNDEAAGWKRYYDEERRQREDAEKERQKAEDDAAKQRLDSQQKELSEKLRAYKENLQQQRQEAERYEREQQARLKDLTQQYSGGMRGSDARSKSIEIEMKTQEQIGQIRQQQIQQYVNGDVKGFMDSQKKQYEILQQSLTAQKQLREKFSKEGNVLDQLKSQMSQKDILNQLKDQRSMDAVRNLAGKDAEGFGAFRRQKSLGRDNVTDEENRMADQFRRSADRAERDARRGVDRDARRGKIGEEEVTKATGDLANKTIDAAQKSGKLSEQQAEAMRAAAKAQQAAADKAVEQGQEIESLKEQFEEISAQLDVGPGGGKASGRARRGGGR